MNDQIDQAIQDTAEQGNRSENDPLNGIPKQIILTFHSNGSIDFAANAIGMMDLWAASKLLSIKGDEVYVSGMNEMRLQMEQQAKKDPMRGIVLVKGMPDVRA